ncbi:MAG: condensation domain-containing protein, partial [Chloroflexota bacterium]
LDDQYQAVPVGLTGELYIGGTQVTRGYLHRPALTAQKFVPNPFPIESTGGRLYKTGDLARFITDDQGQLLLEFVGRVDYQVKIRGYRIELGEIEAVLSDHTNVQSALVMVQETSPQDQRVVAYVVNHQNDQRLGAELRQYLKEKLPPYMIPASIVVLAAWPLTANGKIDRQVLPTSQPVKTAIYVAPSTPFEAALANIWQTVLEVEQVGRHDNFFDLGGHSLLATQVIARIRQFFQIEVPLRRLFEAPDLATLAEAIADGQSSAKDSSDQIVPAPRDGDLPLSFAQQRLWFLDQLEGPNAVYNQFEALQFDGDLDIPALIASLSELINRHEVLRTTFATDATGQVRQAIHPPALLTLPMIDLQGVSSSEQQRIVAQLADKECYKPFNLADDLMLRVTLLRLGAKQFVLFVTMHHIASDGWSMAVLLQEVTTLYQVYRQGGASPLSPLAIQYADFANWQQDWLQGERLQQYLAYWQQQFTPLPPTLNLPLDHPRSAQTTADGEQLTFELSVGVNEGLQILSQQTGTTKFMILLAAFKVLLHRYSGQIDLVVGTPIANRTRTEIEPLLGFFVNTLALRTNLAGNLTFLEVLDQVKEVTQQAYDHQALPFELLVDALNIERSLSQTPLFQVMFAWQNTPSSQLVLPDVTIKQLPQQAPPAKFDLTLTMAEGDAALAGTWHYKTDLFETSTIQQLAAHFETLITSLLANPGQSISAVNFMSAAETQQLLVEWNQTQTNDELLSTSIHHLFEQQARKTPQAIALSFGDDHLTYQQLSQRSNQVAHHLQRLNVTPGSLIG